MDINEYYERFERAIENIESETVRSLAQGYVTGLDVPTPVVETLYDRYKGQLDKDPEDCVTLGRKSLRRGITVEGSFKEGISYMAGTGLGALSDCAIIPTVAIGALDCVNAYQKHRRGKRAELPEEERY